MTLDLSGVRVKLGRAAHHLSSLQSALNDYMSVDTDGAGPGIRLDFDTESGVWKAIAHVPEQVPIEWSVLIGEVLYQLRSSLDHMINCVTTPTRYTSFPIYDDKSNYLSNEARLLAGVPEPYLTLIRELQPFWQMPQTPREHALWALHELARLDRHQFLHVADLWLMRCEIATEPSDALTIDNGIAMPDILEDGARVASGRIVPVDSAADDREVRVALRAAVDLGLAIPSDARLPENVHAAQVVAGLTAMLRHIRDAIVPFFMRPQRLDPYQGS
jgi:hypothetical protein